MTTMASIHGWKHPKKVQPTRLFVGLQQKPGSGPVVVYAYLHQGERKVMSRELPATEHEPEVFKGVAHALVAPVIHSKAGFQVQNGGDHLNDTYQGLSGAQLAIFYQNLIHFQKAMLT